MLAMTRDPQKYLIFLVFALLLSSYLVHEDVALDASDLVLRVEPMTEHLFNIKNYRIAKNSQKSNPSQKLTSHIQYPDPKQGLPAKGDSIIKIIIIQLVAIMYSINKKAPPFLIKTYQMLQNLKYSDTIRWNQQENGFIIQDIQKFSSNILPAYFKHKNMHSYIRQLNMYGFSKKRGKSNNYYYHPYFIRRQPELISQIQRRVQNKQPKMFKASTVSIQEGVPELPHAGLLKINRLLLLEQVANLQLILNEIQDQQLKQQFSQAASLYLENNNQLLLKLNGVQKKEVCITADTLQEECGSAMQESSNSNSCN